MAPYSCSPLHHSRICFLTALLLAFGCFTGCFVPVSAACLLPASGVCPLPAMVCSAICPFFVPACFDTCPPFVPAWRRGLDYLPLHYHGERWLSPVLGCHRSTLLLLCLARYWLHHRYHLWLVLLWLLPCRCWGLLYRLLLVACRCHYLLHH